MERIENTILRNLLYNEEFARKTLPFIKDEYFSVYTDKTIFKEPNLTHRYLLQAGISRLESDI